MQITQTIFASGERFPHIVYEDGSIDFWSTLYVTQNLRLTCKQTTINKILQSIVHLRRWEQLNQRNLMDEFRHQKIPDVDTVISIKQYCALSKQALTYKPKKVISITKLFCAPSPLEMVSKSFQYQRMSDIVHYLVFCGRELCRFKLNAEELYGKIERMEALFKAHYPKSLGHSSRVEHAEANAFETFRLIIRPEHPSNPFSHFDNKLRNYLLIEILYWTGCRPSEALSLTVNNLDYDVTSPTVYFERRHDDPADPRRYQPTLKTLERKIEIPSSLCNDLDYYIRHIRTRFVKAKTHPYLFVSHKGKTAGLPMTDTTFFNRVFAPLRQVDKQFELIQRRGFRIYFNERLTDKIDNHNDEIKIQIGLAETERQHVLARQLAKQLISDGDEIMARQYIMGHSSPMSAKPYLARHIERKARKVHKEMMSETSAVIRQVKRGQNSN